MVVIDGATDDTEAIVRAHAAEDPRIAVLVTANQGVAAARNAGVAESRGDLIAPIDADDLWSPQKTERQVAVFGAHDETLGCVYTAYRLIDVDGRVIRTGPATTIAGETFLRSLYLNFVGNGSALMIRRAAFDSVGGYDPSLRARWAQGAEDRLIQSLIARRWGVAPAPGYLTGYRLTSGTMSSNVESMSLSQFGALEIIAATYPDTPDVCRREAEAVLYARLAYARARRLRLGAAWSALFSAFARDPLVTADILGAELRGIAQRAAGRLERRANAGSGALFLEMDPDVIVGSQSRRPLGWKMRRLEMEEGRFAETPAMASVTPKRPATEVLR